MMAKAKGRGVDPHERAREALERQMRERAARPAPAKSKARETRKIRAQREALEGKREGWSLHWHHLEAELYEAGVRYLSRYEQQGAMASVLGALNRVDGADGHPDLIHLHKIEAARRDVAIDQAVAALPGLSAEMGLPKHMHLRAWHLATLNGLPPQKIGDRLCADMRGLSNKPMGERLRRQTAQGLVEAAAREMAKAFRGCQERRPVADKGLGCTK